MKVGIIIEPNAKGQVVIPKKIRDDLGIKQGIFLNLQVRGGGIYLYPVEEVGTKAETNEAFLEFLQRTQGILAGEEYYKKEKQRRKLALAASASRKKTW